MVSYLSQIRRPCATHLRDCGRDRPRDLRRCAAASDMGVVHRLQGEGQREQQRREHAQGRANRVFRQMRRVE